MVTDVEAQRAAGDEPMILTATGNLDFDARVAAVTGSGVVLVADGEGCTDDAAVTRIRMAVAELRNRHAAPLAVVLTGTVDNPPKLDVPVITLDGGDAASDALASAVTANVPVIWTPQRFQWWLLQQAQKDRRHIVLPEGEDDRILIAAGELLSANICDLTILGDPEFIKDRARVLGLDLSKATLMDPVTSEHLEPFAEEFAEMRKKKGITLDEARETMNDISYFATMMIHKGLADGMVSGAAHTTAHTIKPSFQIIKTKPGASTVSSLFLMVMDDRLWGFADCAVLPKPTPEQLGEIAVVSAETAANFGIDPRVAMMSYSTGESGTGEDVDRVREGLAKARELDPELAVDGPLQFDAAISPSTAKKKMPDSDVAGKATVFVFPDLDAGNIGYKIAQRCGGALAIGPILQGLNKPVNDLSRGATVADIVNTVAITAIQAGGN
ncbi:phosphate acetyltransferase [uncultured Corynebacterium sp.]|uniref:phosphate acetyltransferase n=1 Tax=uncultured Corynebacterium sp. TaxID=159447 RepID=UPI0025D9AEA8|nr:phosphate acetyltransferase [uncultured Corynebacterium sp.]